MVHIGILLGIAPMLQSGSDRLSKDSTGLECSVRISDDSVESPHFLNAFLRPVMFFSCLFFFFFKEWSQRA